MNLNENELTNNYRITNKTKSLQTKNYKKILKQKQAYKNDLTNNKLKQNIIYL